MDINVLLSSIAISGLGFNWIDILILIVLVVYCFEGYALGFYAAVLDLISFIVSFAFGLSFYGLIGQVLVKIFSMPGGFANAIGFFIVAFFTEIIFSFVLKHLVLTTSFITEFESKPENIKKLNNFLGIIPGYFFRVFTFSFYSNNDYYSSCFNFS
jgi:uncharacterized membrane protein required for colicin V production